ncbi:tetratricopeptide repeat protein [Chryseobacterium sp. Mn2064]|uniref:tetratricopeptide repeat protein n=1 Tax=Chryseobacterium sp. Mn2064 TaxID=3395263 RepID=UPI003BC8B8E5
MLDGSRDLTVRDSNILLWKINGNTLCEYTHPVFLEWKSCLDFKLDKRLMRTSKEAGYQIEKLTSDSLIVTQKVEGIDAPDKIKKIWFVNRSILVEDFLSKNNKDSVVASKDFTPSLKRNVISDLLDMYVKKEYSHDLAFEGNILIFPKKQIIKIEINNEEGFQKEQKSIDLFKSTFEKSYNEWDLYGFEKIDKIIIPYKYASKLKKGQGETNSMKISFFGQNNVDFVQKFIVYVKDKKRSIQSFGKAVQAINNNKFDKAIEFFNEAHEYDNTNTDALYNVVGISLAQNKIDVACVALKRLTDLEQTEGTKLFKEKCSNQ